MSSMLPFATINFQVQWREGLLLGSTEACAQCLSLTVTTTHLFVSAIIVCIVWSNWVKHETPAMCEVDCLEGFGSALQRNICQQDLG